MSILSANTLFHFTPEFSWLTNILKVGFIPRYSGEFDKENDIFKSKNSYGMSVPMVCFCDIPISQIKKHIDIYGQYGIGLEKEWGINKGLNPVFYLTKESKYLTDYMSSLKGAESLVWDFHFTAKNGRARNEGERFVPMSINKQDYSDLGFIASQINDRFRRLSVLRKYYKPYSGSFYRNGKIIENYSYYDEREWRFIPTFKINKDNLTVPQFVIEVAVMAGNNREGITKYLTERLTEGLTETELNSWFTPQSSLNNKEYKDKLNAALAISPEFHLNIPLSKIKYIVLRDNEEISKIIHFIRQLQQEQPEKFSSEEVEILITKIITCKQIHEDF